MIDEGGPLSNTLCKLSSKQITALIQRSSGELMVFFFFPGNMSNSIQKEI